MRALAPATLALVLWSGLAAADRGGYTLESFDVTLDVEPDAELLVEERLVVNFAEPRHGIYRMIPVRYTDPRGYLYSLGFRMIEVVDETGAPHRAQASREGRYVNVRIGDPDRTVVGRVVYVLRYRVSSVVAHFANHDELYWNATGNEWEALIESSSATIRLPAPVDAAELEADAYTGRFGSRDQEADVERLPAEGVVRFRTRRALEPLEGLTVVAAWPHGIVHFPGPISRAASFVAGNWIVLAPLFALGLLWRGYRAFGTDPVGPAAIVVRYEPPAELSPGEIGALVDETVDLRDITATVVDLAVRGYLKIRIESEERLFGLFRTEETFFDRADRGWEDLRGFERVVISGLFASGSTVSTKDLEHKFYRVIPAIKDGIWEDLVRKGYVAHKPPSVRTLWKVLGLVAGGVTVGVGMAWASFYGAVFPDAAGIPILSGIVVALLFLAFSRAMPRRTRIGVDARAWAVGFEEFVDRVERDRLEADRRRQVFESLLPYAMALGVASRWAAQFEDLYRAESPAWFGGSAVSGRGFTAPSIESSLSSAMSRAGSGMTAAPRSQGSSGSGGGGSSGGGGGGGGGGSW